jgi:hypothetical protein
LGNFLDSPSDYYFLKKDFAPEVNLVQILNPVILFLLLLCAVVLLNNVVYFCLDLFSKREIEKLSHLTEELLSCLSVKEVG